MFQIKNIWWNLNLYLPVSFIKTCCKLFSFSGINLRDRKVKVNTLWDEKLNEES